MNSNERVTLAIRSVDALRAFSPTGKEIFPRLKRRIEQGEEILVSLSKQSIVAKGEQQARIAENLDTTLVDRETGKSVH